MDHHDPQTWPAAPPPKLLAGFAPRDRRDFLAAGEPVQLTAGESLMEEGERDLSLYLVLSGSVSAWRGGAKVATLGAGEVLNETKMFLPRPNPVAAVCESQEAAILRLRRAELLAYFRDRPERLLKVFVLNIVAILAQKLEDREDAILAGLLPLAPAAEV